MFSYFMDQQPMPRLVRPLRQATTSRYLTNGTTSAVKVPPTCTQHPPFLQTRPGTTSLPLLSHCDRVRIVGLFFAKRIKEKHNGQTLEPKSQNIFRLNVTLVEDGVNTECLCCKFKCRPLRYH